LRAKGKSIGRSAGRQENVGTFSGAGCCELAANEMCAAKDIAHENSPENGSQAIISVAQVAVRPAAQTSSYTIGMPLSMPHACVLLLEALKALTPWLGARAGLRRHSAHKSLDGKY